MDGLTRLRKRKRLTQVEVSKLLGIPRSTLCNYENGNREPDFETIKLFASFYDVSIDELFGRTPKINEAKNAAFQEYEKLPDDKKKIIDDLILALRASDKQ
jgi:transcriptional regulator with XRE-family HTH domain